MAKDLNGQINAGQSGTKEDRQCGHSLQEAAMFLSQDFDKKVDLRTYSPLTLAYVGDAVYEIIVRTTLVKEGNCPVNQLHRKASALVKASAQAEAVRRIEPVLTEEEKNVYRRGRNAHSPTMAKHATMTDYRHATGFEALLGYLYLKGDVERLLELCYTIPEKM